LLVVMFGGIPPPRLSIDENKKMSILFRKVMSAYEQSIYSGNKPYYPYFIYKIIESIFQYNNEKMQLLNYIHLQSRDTVIKNDKIYEKICENYIEGLSYKPTNPEHRLWWFDYNNYFFTSTHMLTCIYIYISTHI
jgi:hypothetical protein